jgi:hypothetical protein
MKSQPHAPCAAPASILTKYRGFGGAERSLSRMRRVLRLAGAVYLRRRTHWTRQVHVPALRGPRARWFGQSLPGETGDPTEPESRRAASLPGQTRFADSAASAPASILDPIDFSKPGLRPPPLPSSGRRPHTDPAAAGARPPSVPSLPACCPAGRESANRLSLSPCATAAASSAAFNLRLQPARPPSIYGCSQLGRLQSLPSLPAGREWANRLASSPLGGIAPSPLRLRRTCAGFVAPSPELMRSPLSFCVLFAWTLAVLRMIHP